VTRITTVQTNFASGEIDRLLRGQTDLKAYNQGAYQLRNVQRLATGGVERRPGTTDLGSIGADARVIDYEFSPHQRYVFAFLSTGALKIYGVDGTLYQTILGGPWDAASLFVMQYTSSGDVFFLCHDDFFKTVTRTGATTFVLGDFAFDQATDALILYQPYYKFAAEDVTLTPSAVSGAITLTASAPVFEPDHVGLRIRIYSAEVLVTAYVSPTIVNGTVMGTLEGKLDLDAFKSEVGTKLVEVLHPFHGLATGTDMTFSGANAIGFSEDGTTAGITAPELAGTFVVSVLDEHRYIIVTGAAADAQLSEDGGGPNIRFDPTGTATRAWMEPSISPVRGYPAACCFHEGRLWIGGTPSQPDSYFGSSSLKPFNFDVGRGLAGQSVQGALGLEAISQIHHFLSNGDLQVYTASGEAIFLSDENPITPANQRISSEGTYGSSHITPQVFDGASLFVPENRLSVNEFVYSNVDQGYVTTAVSTLAGHLLTSGIRDMAVTPGSSSRTEQYAFFVLESGDVAVFHSMRRENIAGWVLWDAPNCPIRSVCAVGNDTFFVANRGGDYRLLKLRSEQFQSLDCSVHHVSGTGPRTSWTLDPRVHGRRCAVISERGYMGEYDIPMGGAFTSSLPVEQLLVGEGYRMRIETVTPRVEMPSGPRDRLTKRIVRSIIEFEDTYSATVDSVPLKIGRIDHDPALAVVPFSGSYTTRRLGFAASPTVVITQEEPTFARVLAMTLEIAV
jgi:hypothetical protein